jgi:hypothetical protein
MPNWLVIIEAIVIGLYAELKNFWLKSETAMRGIGFVN